MENVLKLIQVSIGYVFIAVGYYVVWKGKWYLSYLVNGIVIWIEKDIEYMKVVYGFVEWNLSDFGDFKSDFWILGGGKFYNNDVCYVDGIIKSDNCLLVFLLEYVIDFINNY